MAQGYSLTDDSRVGLPEKFCVNFSQTYFNQHTLRHDEGDMPVDRQRARDVIHYRWRGSEPALREYDSITITDRAGIPGNREHARVELLADPEATGLISALLGLVPSERRQAEGAFGINLFRTFTNVVTSPHHDDEEFVIIYVLDRIGSGAETHLYPVDRYPDGHITCHEPTLTRRLDPGDILIFDDQRFMHDTSPLVPPAGEQARRDALICTVDYARTYLAS
jgi:2OG-Fe dioxygenase